MNEMADLFLERSCQQELAATVAFLTRQLELFPGCQVYDQCCGIGSLSLELSRQQIHVTGADLCSAYIERAVENARAEKLGCQFFCADAFDFVPTTQCDGAFNWYSSFGYSDSDQRNLSMLQRAFESLRPGGMYALDVPNFVGLIRGFQKHLVRRGESNGRQVTCVRESRLNLRKGTLEQTWDWIVEGRPNDRRTSALRIYLPHQIAEMLAAAGFCSIQLFGGLDKRELQLDSPRLIALARRPQ